jgi:hypothetical protein
MRTVTLSALLAASLALGASTANAQQAPPAAEPTAEPAQGILRAPLRAGHGRLRVAVNRPETTVVLDGRVAGTAPLEEDLPAGTHTVRLESPGFKSWEGAVEIVAGTLTPLRAYLRPAPERTGAATTVAVAALIAGAGVGLALASNADRAALDADRAAGFLDNRDPRIDRGATLAALADGGFVLSGLVMALGVYMFAHDPTPPSIARTGRRRPLPVSP